MPMYEFYCRDCHMLFNFLSRRVNTTKRPACPRCGRPDLERQISMFAISKGRPESGDDDMPDIDEARLERAMASLESEAGAINEDDPRQMAGLMRKLFDATGMSLGAGMEEAMRRMEAGEDPEKIEAEMGDVLEQDAPFSGESGGSRLRGLKQKLLPPQVDSTLYEL